MQRKLDFTDRESLSDYRKFLYDVRRLTNSSGFHARDRDMKECDILNLKAVYFPLAVAAVRVNGNMDDRRRFMYRLHATLNALNPEWRNLSTEDSKDLVSVVLDKFSADFETGPSTFRPSLEALKHLVKQRTKLQSAIMTLGARRKRVKTLLMGVSGGKLAPSPELSLLLIDEAERRMDDPNVEFFALHGDWKMVHRYLYHAKIRLA